MYSELTRRIGQQLSVKIEILASVLCEPSIADAIQNLDISTIKSVILSSTSNTHVTDNFRVFALNTLSIQCVACLSHFPRSQMESMLLCSHLCCLECTKDYYRVAINEIQDQKSLSRLTCIQEEHEIKDDQSMTFFILLEAKVFFKLLYVDFDV